MKRVVRSLLPLLLLLGIRGMVRGEGVGVPDPLRPWIPWVLWGLEARACPTPYSDPSRHWCVWPSGLSVDADSAGGRFRFEVDVRHASWVALPGDAPAWPLDVRADGAPVAVVEHGGGPAVRLPEGRHVIDGVWRWESLPGSLAVPPGIGILDLTVDGRAVEVPGWDDQGRVWLRRDNQSGSGEKDFLAVRIASALEDGIPVWLRREIELTVSGSSREVVLGAVLPEAWRVAQVESRLPVALDDRGVLKAQVRAGKWIIRIDAFRLDDPREVRYPAGASPAVAEEWIGFRARPELRVIEVSGPVPVDVSQIPFPDRWRELPVYRWDTATAIRIEERMRGMGAQRPGGLEVTRELWLDEDGVGLTFRDRVTGRMQEIWRLDAAEGVELGSVTSGGEGQLITRNPRNGASGVEIRTRNPDLEATGRQERASSLPATGWRSDAESVRVTLRLPPGWRLLALFGADWVRGDWLTAWTLLDLFVLLVFTVAVGRLSGWLPAALAFVALGLSYHEPGAPRYLWLGLTVPLALARVIPRGRGGRWLWFVRAVAVVALGFVLAPFVARQVQQAIYPQLEPVSRAGWDAPRVASAESDAALGRSMARGGAVPERVMNAVQAANLRNAPDARIQTGPAVPEWEWRSVAYGWNGPVGAAQRVRPVLIPQWLERVLTVFRVVLLLALAARLVLAGRARVMPGGGKREPARAPVVAGLMGLGAILVMGGAAGVRVRADEPSRSGGAIPDATLLAELRDRLSKASDAFPTAADIPSVSLQLDGRRLRIEAEIHVAEEVAVPLPGRLSAWSPVRVTVDDSPAPALRREDGFLWVVLSPGVHRVRLDGGMVDAASSWEWTFLLRPRRVRIEAPGWQVRGVGSDGVPEQQVFFTAEQRVSTGEVRYERQEWEAVARVERRLELGLAWQIRTVVRRLSPPGRAVALRVPLLPGENVLTEGLPVADGMVEVRLGAADAEYAWESGMTPTSGLSLAARPDDTWIEQWRVVASPVWNLAHDGLAPVFEAAQSELTPVWHPWPGESVRLEVVQPEAVQGSTLTVGRVQHTVRLGRRQRTTSLELSVRSSLGEDFVVELPGGAEVVGLSHDGRAVPVRRDGDRLVVPVRPGEQTLAVEWKVAAPLGIRAGPGRVRLPAGAANMHTVVEPPESRWILWTSGPRRGPAVRFWVILVCALLAAGLLARPSGSPLGLPAWVLLGVGLTQVPLPAAAVVVAWLWALAWRGRPGARDLGTLPFNLMQAGLILLTVAALGILVLAVGEGLLGNPEMFITGNGSGRTRLQWFQDRSPGDLPLPVVVSVSIWWYRLLMLLWALWLAMALVGWLATGWRHFSSGGVIRRRASTPSTPPPPSPPSPPSPPPLPVPGP